MDEITFQARLATSPAKLRRASNGLQETPAANSRGNSMRPQAQPKICTVRQLTPPGRPPSPLTSGSATPSKRSLIPAPLSRLVLAGSWEGCIDRSNQLLSKLIRPCHGSADRTIACADCSVPVFKKQPSPFQRIVATQFLEPGSFVPGTLFAERC